MENKRYKEIKIFKSNVLVKRVFFLLNAAFAMAILDLISHVHLPSFVNKLPKYLKHSTFPSCFCSIIIVTGDDCLEIKKVSGGVI